MKQSARRAEQRAGQEQPGAVPGAGRARGRGASSERSAHLPPSYSCCPDSFFFLLLSFFIYIYIFLKMSCKLLAACF